MFNKGKDKPLPAKGLRVTIETADPKLLAKGAKPKSVLEGLGAIVYVEQQETHSLVELGFASESRCIYAIVRTNDVGLHKLLAIGIAAQKEKEQDEGAAQDAEAETRVREAERP